MAVPGVRVMGQDTPLALKPYQRCYYCKVEDARVEGGGLWHCPNDACTGPGGGYRKHVVLCSECVKVVYGSHMELRQPCPVAEGLMRKAGVPWSS